MKLLVVGATGQVARSLVEAGDARNIELVALGRPELDLADPERTERAVEKTMPDLVINAAAYTAVDKAEEEGSQAIAINRYGTGVLAAKCADIDIPLIHLSTDYVFDGTKTTPYTELDRTNPLGMYGHSKLEGEKAVMAANPRHIIMRTAWVYSPFGGNFVKTMLKLAQSRDALNVVDDQRGSPSYAPHIAGGILDIADRLQREDIGEEPWGLYNLAGGGDATWCGLALEVFAQSEKLGGPTAIVHPITTQQYPTPVKRPANSRLDCSKLKKTFDVSLSEWREGVADCVARLLKT